MGGARLRADNADRDHFWRTIQGDQVDTISGRHSVLPEQRGIAHRNLGRRNCKTERLNATRICCAQVSDPACDDWPSLPWISPISSAFMLGKVRAGRSTTWNPLQKPFGGPAGPATPESAAHSR